MQSCFIEKIFNILDSELLASSSFFPSQHNELQDLCQSNLGLWRDEALILQKGLAMEVS